MVDFFSATAVRRKRGWRERREIEGERESLEEGENWELVLLMEGSRYLGLRLRDGFETRHVEAVEAAIAGRCSGSNEDSLRFFLTHFCRGLVFVADAEAGCEDFWALVNWWT